MLPSQLLDTVTQQLETHTQQRQIHQLALAACQQQWPKETDVLAQYRLRDLTQDLTRNHSSFEALKQTLRQALNLAPESQRFIPAGRAILQATRLAYQTDPLKPLLSEKVASDSSSSSLLPPYEEIALVLAQSARATRIRKLIYGVNHGKWSNDPAVLAQFPLSQGIQQLHKDAPELKTLQANLSRVVTTLNRQKAYLRVAKEILHVCQPLYSSFPSLQTYGILDTAIPDTAMEEELNSMELITHPGIDESSISDMESTSQVALPTSRSTPISHSGEINSAHLSSVDAAYPGPWTSPSASQTEASFQEQQAAIAQSSFPRQQSASVQPTTTASSQEAAQPLDWQALAELRVELMRYANPLRVKALIFSTLYYPFDMDANLDWSKLQTETLGDLLLRLVEQFSHYKSLETHLQMMANQLRPSDAYGSTAGAIARAIRPFYP